GNGGTDTIPVDVTIVNLNNDPPTMSAIDSQTTDEDTPLQIPFTVSDPDTADVLTITYGSSDPTLLPAGALSLSGTGTDRILTVTPAANLFGTAHLFVMVSDGQAPPLLQDILLTVNPVNDIPVANAGSLTTAEDTPASGTLTGNDPVEGSPVTFSLVGDNGGAAHGTVTITDASTGAYTYQPDANYNGSDSFSFVSNDGTDDSIPATVSVTVTPVNDAPVANADVLTTNEDTPSTGTLTGSDPVEGSPVTFALSGLNGGAAHGTVVINDTSTGDYTYTPAANYNGPDSFAFVSNDGTDNSAPATVSITVTSVNDIPVANADVLTNNEDTPGTGSLTGSDPVEGSPVTYALVGANGGALHGTVSITDASTGAYAYTPAANYNGGDSFAFVTNDGTDDSAPATITVTVTSVNDAPVANSGSLTMDEDTLGSGTLTGNDPVEGSPVTFALSGLNGGAAHGTVTITNAATGAYTYQPVANYAGADSFAFVSNDGTDNSAPATVSITVNNINDVPVMSTIGDKVTDEDTPLVIPFTVSDADPGDTLTLTVGSSNPTLLPAGSLSLGGVGLNRTLTITPGANLFGTAHVFLSVSDGHAAPVVQVIALTVNSVNDIPVANAGVLTTAEDTPGTGTLTGNDPVEGSPVTFALSGINGGALHGTVVITNASTGAYTYTPAANY